MEVPRRALMSVANRAVGSQRRADRAIQRREFAFDLLLIPVGIIHKADVSAPEVSPGMAAGRFQKAQDSAGDLSVIGGIGHNFFAPSVAKFLHFIKNQREKTGGRLGRILCSFQMEEYIDLPATRGTAVNLFVLPVHIDNLIIFFPHTGGHRPMGTAALLVAIRAKVDVFFGAQSAIRKEAEKEEHRRQCILIIACAAPVYAPVFHRARKRFPLPCSRVANHHRVGMPHQQKAVFITLAGIGQRDVIAFLQMPPGPEVG